MILIQKIKKWLEKSNPENITNGAALTMFLFPTIGFLIIYFFLGFFATF